jgi:hypothetical protein
VTRNLKFVKTLGVRRIGNELQHSKYVSNTCVKI